MTAVLESNNKKNLQKVLEFAIQMGVVVNLRKKSEEKYALEELNKYANPKLWTKEKSTWEHAIIEKHKKHLKKKPVPILGCAKGKMWFADDFDAPLEGFEEYM